MSIDDVNNLWDKLFGAQPDPPALLVLVTALIALVVVAFRPLWRIARNAITIAHEGGHALVALLTGRRLRGIRGAAMRALGAMRYERATAALSPWRPKVTI